MGGLVTRRLLLDSDIKPDGVLFVASPLSGESMERQIRKDLGWLTCGLAPFLDLFDGISPEEFREHFYAQAFPRSRAVSQVQSLAQTKDYLSLNHQFLAKQIPFTCLCE